MEEICALLSAFLCEAGTGSYKIFYEEELMEVLPEEIRNRETLEAALKNLGGGGYVDVKYARGNAFCIAAVKKFEPVIPVATEITEETAAQRLAAPALFPKKAYAYITLCAFLGGAVGGGIAAILGAVL